jgi:hypothetical protein
MNTLTFYAYIDTGNCEIKKKRAKGQHFVGIYQRGYAGPLFRLDVPFDKYEIKTSYDQNELMTKIQVISLDP